MPPVIPPKRDPVANPPVVPPKRNPETENRIDLEIALSAVEVNVHSARIAMLEELKSNLVEPG